MALKAIEIYFITPKEATNLITNPSFEAATTGYAAAGAGVSIAQSTTYQRRGAASCEVTTASGVASGLYYAVALTSGTAYTFSADVLDVTGQAFNIYFANASGTLQGTATTWTGSGHWVRKSVTWTASSSATFRLYITRSSVASTTKFYVDGCQLEADTAATTYFDGDSVGFNRLRKDFGWNGTAHASTSWRSVRTRAGGSIVRLRDYASIIGTNGLGMQPLTNNTIPTSGMGSFYQNTRAGDREFQISVHFSGAEHQNVIANRQAVIAAVRPGQTADDQPLMVRWQLEDENGNPISYPVELASVYEGGLEHDTTGQLAQFEDKAVMRFKSYLPFVVGDGNSAFALGYQTSVSDFANIGYRDTDGQWKAMGSGVNGAVYALAVGLDGSIYAGGAFTSAGGVSNTGHIAKWTGAAWEALGSGLNNDVNTLAVGPDGSLYAGGAFTASGAGVLSYVAKWNGSAWSDMTTGMDAAVNALVFDQSGNLYAGGAFSTAGGGAAAYMAVWNGSVWAAMDTGTASAVNALTVGPTGYVYAGTDTAVMRWNGSAWSAVTGTFNDSIRSLVFGPGSALYAGGEFSGVTTDGVLSSIKYISKWSGSAWGRFGTGADAAVYALYYGSDGNLYAGGSFTQMNGVSLPDRGAVYMRGNWTPFDVDVQDVSAIFRAIVLDPSGRLFLGGEWSGTTALSATVAAPNGAGAKSYPIIIFTGPGSVWQVKNYSTGDAIYFSGLTLLAGETATLDLRPQHLAFTSTFRGNLIRYIVPGSSLDFPLLAGNNNVSAFMTGTTAASAISMRYVNYYWSTDGAVW